LPVKHSYERTRFPNSVTFVKPSGYPHCPNAVYYGWEADDTNKGIIPGKWKIEYNSLLNPSINIFNFKWGELPLSNIVDCIIVAKLA